MRLSGISSEKWNFIIKEAVKMPQGVYLWYVGVPYPRRVYYDKTNDINFALRVLDALGMVKKFLFSLMFLKDIVFPRTLNIKKYQAFLYHVYWQIHWILAEFYIKKEEYSVPVREVGIFVKRFLFYLGFNEDLAGHYADVVMMVLEFDNAYRYRLQDIVGETSKELLKNRKEIIRLKEIYLKRELQQQDVLDFGARGKIARVFAFFSYALWIPKFRRAFDFALEGIDLEKIKLDINDRYHTSFWRGYDYEGKDFDTRYQFFLDTHKDGFPPYVKRQDPNETAKFLIGE